MKIYHSIWETWKKKGKYSSLCINLINVCKSSVNWWTNIKCDDLSKGKKYPTSSFPRDTSCKTTDKYEKVITISYQEQIKECFHITTISNFTTQMAKPRQQKDGNYLGTWLAQERGGSQVPASYCYKAIVTLSRNMLDVLFSFFK